MIGIVKSFRTTCPKAKRYVQDIMLVLQFKKDIHKNSHIDSAKTPSMILFIHKILTIHCLAVYGC